MKLVSHVKKDHFIPHIAEKSIGKKLFQALGGLFHSYCVSRHMLLQNKL
jgi:hypothetical protein